MLPRTPRHGVLVLLFLAPLSYHTTEHDIYKSHCRGRQLSGHCGAGAGAGARAEWQPRSRLKAIHPRGWPLTAVYKHSICWEAGTAMTG